MQNNFKLIYNNIEKKNCKTGIEIDEDYSFEWGFTDYDCPSATIELEIGKFNTQIPLDRFGYPLFSDLKNFIDFLEDRKKFIEPYASSIPEYSPHSKTYSITLSEFIINTPVIFLIEDGEWIKIYVRTLDEKNRKNAIVSAENNSKEAIYMDKLIFLREVSKFLTSYFTDVVNGIPGLEKADGYSEMAQFIRSLKKYF